MYLKYDLKSVNPNKFDEKSSELLRTAIGFFEEDKIVYDKIYDYCVTGHTDAWKEYKRNKFRTNIKIRTNFIKKFIREEVSYLLANKVTYIAKENHEIVDVIHEIIKFWNKNHDKEFLRNVLSFGKCFELYYIKTEKVAGKTENVIYSKIVSPRKGFMIYDDRTNSKVAFLYFYTLKYDKSEKVYIDIYTKDYIFHVDKNLQEIIPPTPNVFDDIPVVEGKISDNGVFDTLFNELADLVDAYQTNLSDIVNEISDYRLAYLTMTGCEIDDTELDEHGETDLDKMKKEGVINVPTPDAKIAFLTKDINDTFVQNTLTTLKSNIYEIANHINTNEKMSSNLSGTAVRSRLIGLEQAIRNSEGVMKNVIKERLYFLIEYYNKVNRKNFDWREITVKFTLNIPRDDMNMAQTLSQLPEGYVSKKTGRAQLSFIDNPEREAELVEQEQKEDMEQMLDVTDIQIEHYKQNGNLEFLESKNITEYNSKYENILNSENKKNEEPGMNEHNKKLEEMRKTRNE